MLSGQFGNKAVIVAVATGVIGLIIGVLIGRYATSTTEELPSTAEQKMSRYQALLEDKWKTEGDTIEKIINSINRDNLRENLRILSSKPHLATTPRDEELAKLMKGRFLEAGFDWAELLPQYFTLSMPDRENPNFINITEDGVIKFSSHYQEEPLLPEDYSPDFVHAFNAFTPAGEFQTPRGEGVVYVNYGEKEDFDLLAKKNIKVEGCIAIARYGKIFRGNKIKHAEEAGAKAVILFTDPADVAIEGTDKMDVYPYSWWLPGTGMQRGYTFVGLGDPLTPGWPTTKHAHRIPAEDAGFHKIPAQPIGYSDALEILKMLGGEKAPLEWQGGLNIDYNFGPAFTPDYGKRRVVIKTNNYLINVTSYNVLGTIRGDVEPDRYVLIGNHRDAWGYGAADPSSGTSQLLETARVLGNLKKEGWRPRRTIVFCSWGSEEYGMIGSTEWVEENVDKLQERAVAYLNTDTCAAGDALYLRASPMLWDAAHFVAKQVPGVHDSSKTLYDEQKEYHKQLYPHADDHPVMSILVSGSDHVGFIFFAGVPSLDVSFKRNKVKYNITTYPYYHTGYETFTMMANFTDPDFKVHQACGRIASLTVKYLSDSSIIPYSIVRFPQEMKKGLQKISKAGHDGLLTQIFGNYSQLGRAVDDFIEATKSFMDHIEDEMDKFDALQLRKVNDQMMKLEQVFVIPAGLPGRPTIRHAIFAPSQFDSYAAAGFPGINDLLHGYNDLSEQEKAATDEEIRRHISLLIIMTDRATSTLRDVHKF